MTDRGPHEPGDASADPAGGPAFGAGRPAGGGPTGPDVAGGSGAPIDAPAADPEPGSGSGSGSGDRSDAAQPIEAVDAEVAELGELVQLEEADPIVALTRERDDYREALIRLQADFENYKKRMIKQQTDHLERAATALVDKLLPVLDTADLALAHGGGEDSSSSPAR